MSIETATKAFLGKETSRRKLITRSIQGSGALLIVTAIGCEPQNNPPSYTINTDAYTDREKSIADIFSNALVIKSILRSSYSDEIWRVGHVDVKQLNLFIGYSEYSGYIRILLPRKFNPDAQTKVRSAIFSKGGELEVRNAYKKAAKDASFKKLVAPEDKENEAIEIFFSENLDGETQRSIIAKGATVYVQEINKANFTPIRNSFLVIKVAGGHGSSPSPKS